MDPDRRRALELVPVSRETEARLDVLVEGLRRWQGVKNLVGPASLGAVWTRHVADSAQLLAHAPHAPRWADLGSGAGFPGLVVAILLTGRPGACVHLIEANGRKCAFLREVARDTGAPAEVHNARIEDVLPGLTVDIVTARALAPLPRLVEFSKTALERGAVGLFLKSQAELEGADLSIVGLDVTTFPSRTAEEGRIVRVTRRETAPDL